MSSPTPTVDQVLNAVESELRTINNPPAEVLHWEIPVAREEELLRDHRTADGEISLATVGLESARLVAGDASGEDYQLYSVRVRYYYVSTVDPGESSRTGLTRAQLLIDELDKNDSVFRIGGQAPLLGTAETAELSAYGLQAVGEFTVFVAEIGLTVEARRWA